MPSYYTNSFMWDFLIQPRHATVSSLQLVNTLSFPCVPPPPRTVHALPFCSDPREQMRLNSNSGSTHDEGVAAARRLRLEHAALEEIVARVRGVHERCRSRRRLAPQARGGSGVVGGSSGDVGLRTDRCVDATRRVQIRLRIPWRAGWPRGVTHACPPICLPACLPACPPACLPAYLPLSNIHPWPAATRPGAAPRG